MNAKEKPQETFFHENKEQNLLAAKRALRRHRTACICRRTEFSEDVIDVVDFDGRIIERHVVGGPQQLVVAVACFTPVEEMALYQ